jgi:hypothetical protein
MVDYCEKCGEELLDSDEMDAGLCETCKSAQQTRNEYKKDEDYIDPGIT